VRETLDDIIQGEGDDVLKVPIMFLLNKNDKSEFRGVDFISDKLQINQINA
jgi:hypothetical protein